MLDGQKSRPKPLKAKNFIYDLEENTNTKAEPDMKLILTSFVEGIVISIFILYLLNYLFVNYNEMFILHLGVGLKNDVVTVRPNFGRTELLLRGLAVYASPENLEKLTKWKELENKGESALLLHSSRFAELVYRFSFSLQFQNKDFKL